VQCVVNGSLLETNERFTSDPNILLGKPLTFGFVAILQITKEESERLQKLDASPACTDQRDTTLPTTCQQTVVGHKRGVDNTELEKDTKIAGQDIGDDEDVVQHAKRQKIAPSKQTLY